MRTQRQKAWGTLKGVNITSSTIPHVSVSSAPLIESILLTARHQAVQEAIAKLRPFNTINDLAEITRYSPSEVRQQLHERFKDCPDKAMKNRSGVDGNGARWVVYKGAAALWIEELYG
jgi:hypothetical protein